MTTSISREAILKIMSDFFGEEIIGWKCDSRADGPSVYYTVASEEDIILNIHIDRQDKRRDQMLWKLIANVSMKPFVLRIERMNKTFNLPSNTVPTDQGPLRLLQAYKVIVDEVTELLECTDNEDLRGEILKSEDPFLKDATEEDLNKIMPPASTTNLTAIADTLGDLVVYAFSEALRWGIPLIDVLHIIMDSQDSKLVDGKPLMSEDGSKFIKGPNFEPPEPKICALLESLTPFTPETI